MTFPASSDDSFDPPADFHGGPSASKLPAPAPGSAGLILLVEDNATNLRLGTIMLQRLGFEVDAATNGREALAQVFNRPYRAVIMDCEMPVLDGYDATRAIRRIEQTRPDVPHIPVIALTANILPGAKQACLDAGMDLYLSKPIRLDQLREALARALPH